MRGQVRERPERLVDKAHARKALAETAATIGVGVLVYSLVPMTGPDAWIGLVLGLAAVALVIPVTARRLRAINHSDRPISDAIQAVVLVTTLLVLGFAAAYVVMADTPGQMSGVVTKIDAVYFSVTTLSTVGFGDIHATGQKARLVVTFQMIFDLALIAAAFRLIGGMARERAAAIGESLAAASAESDATPKG